MFFKIGNIQSQELYHTLFILHVYSLNREIFNHRNCITLFILHVYSLNREIFNHENCIKRNCYTLFILYSIFKYSIMETVSNTLFILSVFQVDFEIFRISASFIKISLIIKLIFIKFFRTIWEIGGQMSWDRCLAESLF